MGQFGAVLPESEEKVEQAEVSVPLVLDGLRTAPESGGRPEDSDVLQFDYSDERKKSEWFPFLSREHLLFAAWQEIHRISVEGLDSLLQILHEPGFRVAALPKSAYLLNKCCRESLPIIVAGITPLSEPEASIAGSLMFAVDRKGPSDNHDAQQKAEEKQ
jgi:hypothetical protein